MLRLVPWAPAALYMGLIWILSSLRLADVPVDAFPFGDKGVHVVEYAILAFLLAHASLRTWPRHHPARTLAFAVFVTLVWGFADEIHQALVPGRSAQGLDLVADAVGAVLGAGARYAVAAPFLLRARRAEVAR